MSKKRRRRSKSRSSSVSSRGKRSTLRTVVETFMGVAIGVGIIAIAVWWFFLRTPDELVDNSAASTAIVKGSVKDSDASFEEVRDEGTLEQQLELIDSLSDSPKGSEIAVQLETVSRRIEIAQAILKRDEISEEQRAETATKLIQSAEQSYGIGWIESIDSEGEIFNQLLEITNPFVSDSNSEIAALAKMAQAKAKVYHQLRNNRVADVGKIKSGMTELITSLPDDNAAAETVVAMALFVKSIDAEAGYDVMRQIVTDYESPSEAVAPSVRLLAEQLILVDSGISELAKEAVQTKDYDAYIEKLGELSDYPNTGADIVNRVANAIYTFEAIGRNDLAIRVLERLQSTAAARSDPAARLRAQQVAKFGLIRNRQVGKPFDFNDVDYLGKPLAVNKFENVPVLLIFYSPNAATSRSAFESLEELYLHTESSRVRFLAISVEEPASKAIGETFINSDWENNASSVKKPSEIFKRCPVLKVPYFALVNKNGVLQSLNVPLSELKTRIEALASE